MGENVVSDGVQLMKEIQLAEDECCIVFDFSCLYPYYEKELLTFDFQLGMEELPDKKLNHRYTNTNYFTLSRKYGRRVSRLGYPYVMKLDNQLRILVIRVGVKFGKEEDETVKIVFPLKTEMTKEKPVCNLSMGCGIDDGYITLRSTVIDEKRHEHSHIWTKARAEEDMNYDDCDTVTFFEPPQTIPDAHAIIFNETITPIPTTIDKLYIR